MPSINFIDFRIKQLSIQPPTHMHIHSRSISSTSYSKRNFHCDYVTIQKLFKMMWSEYFNPLRKYTMPLDVKMNEWMNEWNVHEEEREKNFDRKTSRFHLYCWYWPFLLDTSGLWPKWHTLSSHALSVSVQSIQFGRQCICRCQLIAYMIPLSYPKHFDLMHLLLLYSMGSELILHQTNERKKENQQNKTRLEINNKLE